MPANLPVNPPSLASDFCFESWQQIARDLVGGAQVVLDNSGWSVVLSQGTAPTSAQRSYLWFNTNYDRIYRWNADTNSWVARHQYGPASSMRLWWEDTLPNLKTFDGGEDAAVGDASGPMWEEDTEYQGKFPFHAGTVTGVGAIALSAEGGEGRVTLAQVNLPNITLSLQSPFYVSTTSANVDQSGGLTAVGGTGRIVDTSQEDWARQKVTFNSPALGSGTPFNIMPPYRAGYIIKRTARIFYKAA